MADFVLKHKAPLVDVAVFDYYYSFPQMFRYADCLTLERGKLFRKHAARLLEAANSKHDGCHGHDSNHDHQGKYQNKDSHPAPTPQLMHCMATHSVHP